MRAIRISLFNFHSGKHWLEYVKKQNETMKRFADEAKVLQSKSLEAK